CDLCFGRVLKGFFVVHSSLYLEVVIWEIIILYELPAKLYYTNEGALVEE
ncbi:unnamed protein product, partial [Allacma fusca]